MEQKLYTQQKNIIKKIISKWFTRDHILNMKEVYTHIYTVMSVIL